MQAYYIKLCDLQYEDQPDYYGLKSCINKEIARLNQFYDDTGEIYHQLANSKIEGDQN